MTLDDKIRVLVLDDEARNREDIKKLLHSKKIRVQKCFNISDAVKFIETGSFDILVSDIKVDYREKNPRIRNSKKFVKLGKKPKFASKDNFLKAVNEERHRIWTALDLVSYAISYGVIPIVVSAYQPETLPLEEEYFIRKNGDYLSKLKAVFEKVLLDVGSNKRREYEVFLEKFTNEMDYVQLVLSHLQGLKEVDFKGYFNYFETGIKGNWENRNNLEFYIQEDLRRLNAHRMGVFIALNEEIGRNNLQTTFYRLIKLQNSEFSEEREREISIIGKYLKKLL